MTAARRGQYVLTFQFHKYINWFKLHSPSIFLHRAYSLWLGCHEHSLMASSLESNVSYGMLVSCPQEHGPWLLFLSFFLYFFLYKPLFSLIDQFSCSGTDVIRYCLAAFLRSHPSVCLLGIRLDTLGVAFLFQEKIKWLSKRVLKHTRVTAWHLIEKLANVSFELLLSPSRRICRGIAGALL